MLNVLGDIEIAVTLQKADSSKAGKLAPHPADETYAKLGAELDPVDPKSDEYDMIQTYIDNTARSGRVPKMIRLIRLDRKGEGKRFDDHSDLDNRKLLWHGTNVAVVAAICKTGLRIMPHSGGLVCKGLYTPSD